MKPTAHNRRAIEREMQTRGRRTYYQHHAKQAALVVAQFTLLILGVVVLVSLAGLN
jgi:hypothetical protein